MKKLRLISLLLTLALACFGLVLGGCTTGAKADPKAAEACKEAAKASSEVCKACCKAAGSSGHMWTSGSGCKCL